MSDYDVVLNGTDHLHIYVKSQASIFQLIKARKTTDKLFFAQSSGIRSSQQYVADNHDLNSFYNRRTI